MICLAGERVEMKSSKAGHVNMLSILQPSLLQRLKKVAVEQVEMKSSKAGLFRLVEGSL